MSFRFCKKKRVFAYVMSNVKVVVLVMVLVVVSTLTLMLTQAPARTSWFPKLMIDGTETITAFKQKENVDQVFVVDRLEGNYAICQDVGGEVFNREITDFPKGIKEGDVINRIDDKYVINREDTITNKKKIEENADKMWE